MPRSVSLENPTRIDGFAESPDESAHPELWKGLVGAWDMGLGPTGGTLFDASGRKRNGTWNGTGTHWVVNDGRYAGQYNGSDDHVALGDYRSQFTDRVSVLARIVLNTSGSFRMILSAAKAGGDGSEGFELRSNSSGQINFSVDTVTGGRPSSGAGNDMASIGGWHFVAGTYDGVAVRAYSAESNMQLFAHPADTSGSGNIEFGAAGSTWRIGDRGSVGGFRWTGLIGEVLVYNRTLTFSELITHRQLGRGGIFQRRPITLAKAPVEAVENPPYGGGVVVNPIMVLR